MPSNTVRVNRDVLLQLYLLYKIVWEEISFYEGEDPKFVMLPLEDDQKLDEACERLEFYEHHLKSVLEIGE